MEARSGTRVVFIRLQMAGKSAGLHDSMIEYPKVGMLWQKGPRLLRQIAYSFILQ